MSVLLKEQTDLISKIKIITNFYMEGRGDIVGCKHAYEVLEEIAFYLKQFDMKLTSLEEKGLL